MCYIKSIYKTCYKINYPLVMEECFKKSLHNYDQDYSLPSSLRNSRIIKRNSSYVQKKSMVFDQLNKKNSSLCSNNIRDLQLSIHNDSNSSSLFLPLMNKEKNINKSISTLVQDRRYFKKNDILEKSMKLLNLSCNRDNQLDRNSQYHLMLDQKFLAMNSQIKNDNKNSQHSNSNSSNSHTNSYQNINQSAQQKYWQYFHNNFNKQCQSALYQSQQDIWNKQTKQSSNNTRTINRHKQNKKFNPITDSLSLSYKLKQNQKLIKQKFIKLKQKFQAQTNHSFIRDKQNIERIKMNNQLFSLKLLRKQKNNRLKSNVFIVSALEGMLKQKLTLLKQEIDI